MKEGRKEGRRGGANSESTHLLQLLWPCNDDLPLEMYYLEHAGSCYKLDGEEDHSKSLHMKIWTHCSHSL
jgi:hypothetical protein